MGVHAGVMDADVGQEPADDDHVDMQAAEQHFQVGGEERAVAALLDQPLAVAGLSFRKQLYARGSLDAMNRLGPIQFPPEVDKLAAVDLLSEDHRDHG